MTHTPLPQTTKPAHQFSLSAIAVAIVIALAMLIPSNAWADVFTDWDESTAPEYYARIDDAQCDHQSTTPGVSYGGFDSFGRATWAALYADYAWYQKEESEPRETDELPDPKGWPTNFKASIQLPNGNTYNGYFWNRCHLIADALGGDPIAENLVSGTRMLNVAGNNGKGGMLYLENLARQWLGANAANGGTLYYCATPVYVDNELTPRSVVIDIKSSDGTLDDRYVVYNAAKGYDIDYALGTVTASGADTPTEDTTQQQVMYRMYNPFSGEHFYTANASERNSIYYQGWVYEGVGWYAPTTSASPVYRLYNSFAGEHHYTLHASERNALVSAGWTDEGIGWYSDDASTVPLYRQYNPYAFACNHNYTTDINEHYYLISVGWLNENIAWYGAANNNTATVDTSINTGKYEPPAPSGGGGSSSGGSSSGGSTGVVYWTPSGERYHSTTGCPSLSRSKTILSGNISEAGSRTPCQLCW